jgi:hypothetical protein
MNIPSLLSFYTPTTDKSKNPPGDLSDPSAVDVGSEQKMTSSHGQWEEVFMETA